MLFLPGGAHRFQGEADPLVDFRLLAEEPQLAIHHGGKIEQLINHAGERASVPLDHVHILLLACIQCRIGSQQVSAGNHRCQRCPQLVAERGEKLVLQLGGFVQLLVLFLQFTSLIRHPFFQSHIGFAQGFLLKGKARVFILQLLLRDDNILRHRVEGLTQVLDFVAGIEVGPGLVIAPLQPPHHPGERLDGTDDGIGEEQLDEDRDEGDRPDHDPHQVHAIGRFPRFIRLQTRQRGLGFRTHL